MSLDAMLAVFKLPADSVSSGERLLLLAIAESAGENGECSAYTRRQEFLAWKCGWTETSTLRKHLRTLKAKGLLEVRSGRCGNESDYRLTFLDSVAHGSLSSVYWKLRNTVSAGPNGPPPTGPNGPPPTGPFGPAIKQSTSFPLLPVQKRSRVRGLKQWFDSELWPRFPDQVDKLNTWCELERLNPGQELRAEIIAGLERAIANQERETAESIDGFVRALPTPRNWLAGRRWEDGV